MLASAIASLPGLDRWVVVMRLLEGRSFAEIGAQLGASEGACKLRFERGLEALRRLLEQAGVEAGNDVASS